MAPIDLGRILDDSLRRRVARLQRLRRCADRLAGSPARRPAVVQAMLAERVPGYGPGDSDLETRVLWLAIELDGWQFHRSRTAFDGDRARANLLVTDGWSLVRFTSRCSDADIVHCVRTARRRFGRPSAA